MPVRHIGKPSEAALDINEAITATVTGIEGVGGIETRGNNTRQE